MDVVWLKKDVRLRDHGALAAAVRGGRPFCILYMYEPDQLAHHSVHGSHIHFANEGVADLDGQLRELMGASSFCITIVVGEATANLAQVHAYKRIVRLLAHQETGHGISYSRDKRVRQWCQKEGVSFLEFVQTGVTRGLRDRNLFTPNFNAFVAKQQHPTPSSADLKKRLIIASAFGSLHCGLLRPGEGKLIGLAQKHVGDREDRQHGGERRAECLYAEWLRSRGERYSQDISSPNSAWASCSRISPYLTAGHLSLRGVLQSLKQRQLEERARRKALGGGGESVKNGWLRSLAAFGSRLRWRAHFIQKFESECAMEHRAQCHAYDGLRCAPGDWDAALYAAWESGRTGFPFVDACMRCLAHHGWLNFRMRAMVVSFACYNLWLDWRGIAPHLARTFLDYEPGIHYPQLQMQQATFWCM